MDHMGPQSDGTFIVATGQRIEPGTIHFAGRPIDLALHPTRDLLAILDQGSVLLATRAGVVAGSEVKTLKGASYRGCVWHPDGNRLFVSLTNGQLQEFRLEGDRLVSVGPIDLKRAAGAVGGGPSGSANPTELEHALPAEVEKRNPVPGGMCITRDGTRLFVACASRGAVVEVDLTSRKRVADYPTQNVPFEVRLSEDERTLIVSNWAGREATKEEREEDETADSDGATVVVDPRGVVSTGTVSLIDRATRSRTDLLVGRHPAGLAVRGHQAFVANAGDDSVSEIDLGRKRVARTMRLRWGKQRLFGSMPNVLALKGGTLYTCNGGDNAVCEMDLRTGKVRGFRPAGFYPVGICLARDGRTAYVVNTKGNGSVQNTTQGKPGNAHNFQGTVSVIDLTADLDAATRRVAELNYWHRSRQVLRPKLAVYGGAIKHVLYIIKENRTYDEVFGDMPQGNGDKSLCGLPEEVTPNHHALARQFTLFDNAYVSGTNSAEGHQWATEGLGNDYIERFYGGYARSYPYDGTDAMAYSSGGFIWDAALKKGRTVRNYGEFCSDQEAKLVPNPRNWMVAWWDRQSGKNSIKVTAYSRVQGLRAYTHPSVTCWPLLTSDQWRADQFIEDYQRLSRDDKVPNLMLLTLPSDHTEGTNPKYPKPKSMVADNDLALGRVVDAVSHSPQWKDTCIFVMEDDAQAGPDHVDGHRTVCLALSPYVRRGFVDSSLYTQISILRSIELMLGLDPMTRFDALCPPFAACFQETPDLTPYTTVQNRVKLGDMNPPLRALRGDDLFYAKKTLELDFSGVDTADWYWLNRIVWHSLHGGKPYPVRRG
jgi:hypothetical protein